MTIKAYFVFALFIGITLSLNSTFGPLFWPLPQKYSIGNQTFSVNPCSINYKVPSTPIYFRETIDFYLTDVFKCSKASQQTKLSAHQKLNVTLTITVKNTTLTAPFVGLENYSLQTKQNGQWILKSDYYPGFLRGFQTFSQFFKLSQEQENYYVEGLPISVTDYPEFQWRGVMIDTSRHFLKVDVIKRTIDACLFNKANVLHWHITDEDSFPLQITSRPQISKYGSFKGKTYSKTNVLDIVQYALRKGVRVIPQIDTPAHTASWGRSEQLKDITVNCQKYEGQLDPTIDLTYQVVTDVLKELNSLFIDPVAHFGGDQINTKCWDTKPSIKQFMNKNNILTYNALQEYFRKKQKQIWKTISNKSISYWANQAVDLHTDSDDIIQWWGNSGNAQQLGNRTNKVVLSYKNISYLNLGFGSKYGEDYGNSIQTWKTNYDLTTAIPNIKSKILGAEALLWSQVSNQHTHHQKMWPRSSAIIERVWNTHVTTRSYTNIVSRLSEHARRLNYRGIPAMPVSNELCQRHAQLCF